MNKLTCFLTKSNPFDDATLILGYPILLEYDDQNQLCPKPIPEMLSYEGYIC